MSESSLDKEGPASGTSTSMAGDPQEHLLAVSPHVPM